MRAYADHAGVRRSCGRGNGRACSADSAPLLAYALGLGLARRYRHYEGVALRSVATDLLLRTVIMLEHGWFSLAGK
jgi:hypothetical protein